MSWVYFIREGDSGPIKIGRSDDPWKRLDSLQIGNPRRLVLIAARRIGKSVHIIERDIHGEFQTHQILGEWYAPVDGLISLAAEYGQPMCTTCGCSGVRMHFMKHEHYKPRDERHFCFRCLNAAEADKIRKIEGATSPLFRGGN
jgi:hypothetical protein